METELNTQKLHAAYNHAKGMVKLLAALLGKGDIVILEIGTPEEHRMIEDYITQRRAIDHRPPIVL
jgi:hypothetical protein